MHLDTTEHARAATGKFCSVRVKVVRPDPAITCKLIEQSTILLAADTRPTGQKILGLLYNLKTCNRSLQGTTAVSTLFQERHRVSRCNQSMSLQNTKTVLPPTKSRSTVSTPAAHDDRLLANLRSHRS